jgi:hypothetical protein
MSPKNQTSNRRRRKIISFAWIAALSILVIALIYWEQTALLYILATLGVTALLVVVAVADLHDDKPTKDAISASDGAGIKSTFGDLPSSNR